MRYFAHIEVELEADSLQEAEEEAYSIASDTKDANIFTVIDAFVVNVE